MEKETTTEEMGEEVDNQKMEKQFLSGTLSSSKVNPRPALTRVLYWSTGEMRRPRAKEYRLPFEFGSEPLVSRDQRQDEEQDEQPFPFSFEHGFSFGLVVGTMS
jgi:hypothetical protein